MKDYGCRSVRFVSLLFALLGVMVSTTKAGPGADFAPGRQDLMGNSGLVILREADFGTNLGLSVYIDGILITSLSRGEGYQAIVRPGRHVLSVADTPCPYGKTKFTRRTIDFVPGANYTFTAIWDVENIVLDDGHHRHTNFDR